MELSHNCARPAGVSAPSIAWTFETIFAFQSQRPEPEPATNCTKIPPQTKLQLILVWRQLKCTSESRSREHGEKIQGILLKNI